MIAWLAAALANGVLHDGSPYVPLRSLDLEVAVDGRVAEGTAHYVFDPAAGGRFAAGLPEGAAVIGLRVLLDGVWTDATAGAALGAPGSPIEVIDALPGDLFEVVLPGGSSQPVEIELRWQALLAAREGSLTLDIPLSDGGLNPSDPTVTWRAEIRGNAALDSLIAQPGTFSIDGGVGSAAGARPLSELDRWTLSWTEPPALFGIDVRTFRPTIDPYTGEGEPDGYALVTLLPGPEDPDARVDALYTFVLDSSASMQGRSMDTAVAAASAWLRALEPTDRFNLVPYTSVAIPFRGRAPLATEGAVDRAIRFLERQKPAGLSDPQDGLITGLTLLDDTVNQRSFFSCAGTAAADGPPVRGAEIVPATGKPVIAAPYVVWLTDGGASTGETDSDAIVDRVRAANRVGASIFAVGVGDQVDRDLLERVAGATRGEVRYAERVADVPGVVAALRDRIANPVLVHPSVVVPGVTDQAPAALPDVALGTEVVLAFRYAEPGAARLRLTGLRGQRQTTERFDLLLPGVDEAEPAVARAWAQLRVRDLDQRWLDGDQRVYDEIYTLVSAYGVASDVVTLDFGSTDPYSRGSDAMASADYAAAAGCGCVTSRGLAGGLPVLVALGLTMWRRRER